MKCYHPVKAFRTPTGVVFEERSRHDIIGTVELRCGQCIGCRERRASDWSVRIMHEASLWRENCFVTLTYAPGNLPPGASLEHRDFQLFFKRLRKRFAPSPVRFYMCGEYGDEKGRPHYHACLFNVDFRSDRVPRGKSKAGELYYESALLSQLWTHGRAVVQDLCRETASYCARYIMQKQTGDAGKAAYWLTDEDGVMTERTPPYNAMSLKPGIGALWFDQYARDVYPHDFVVARGRATSGAKLPAPKYYDKLLKRRDIETFESVAQKREDRAREAFADNTEDRLKVREQVHAARISTLTRGSL